MKKSKLILMADIIDSSSYHQAQLMTDFAEIVVETNRSISDAFLSPLTITLGDEFQAVVKDLVQVINVIQHIEEAIVRSEKGFKLRYVVVEGVIDTPINHEIAYGMLGEGLTRARQNLNDLKKSDHRFHFNLKDQYKQDVLNNLFIASQSITDDWNPKRDYYLVSSFLAYDNYKDVALALHKERSLMWKRKKSLKIDAYNALKKAAKSVGEHANA